MNLRNADWGSVIGSGIFAGVLWGLLSLIINKFTGAFPFESSVTHNIIIFAASGAIFGIVTSGLLLITGNLLPFKRHLAKAVLVSLSLWVVLRLAGMLLTSMDPMRYHLVNPETIQGLILAIVLGLFLGLAWERMVVRSE